MKPRNQHRFKRFIETTLPMITLHGFIVWAVTFKAGFLWGLLPILIYTIVDVMMER